MRVLIAEDEEALAGTVARGLRREGMAVDVATDGADALYEARVVDYDVVLLDRDLPRVHGDDVARGLVEERPNTKILMVTGARGIDEVVAGLTIGARRLPAQDVPVRRARRPAARPDAAARRRAPAGAARSRATSSAKRNGLGK